MIFFLKEPLVQPTTGATPSEVPGSQSGGSTVVLEAPDAKVITAQPVEPEAPSMSEDPPLPPPPDPSPEAAPTRIDDEDDMDEEHEPHADQ